MLKHKIKGFTILELLIVMVVIGILAVISMIAYNGIRTRANNATIATTVENYAKAASLYYADLRKWPLQMSSVSGVACIGNTATYSTTYVYLTPGKCSTLVNAETSTEFDTALAPYVSAPPNLRFMEPIQYTPSQKYGRGIYYMVTCLKGGGCTPATTPASEVEVTINYTIKSTGNCVIGTSLYNMPTTGFTTCTYYVQRGVT